jgi:hypothetical protein
MVFFAIIGLILGIALAQYFQALVLLPATLIALAGVAFSENGGHALGHVIFAGACAAFALQSRFLGGAFVGSFFTERSGRPASTRCPAYW